MSTATCAIICEPAATATITGSTAVAVVAVSVAVGAGEGGAGGRGGDLQTVVATAGTGSLGEEVLRDAVREFDQTGSAVEEALLQP